LVFTSHVGTPLDRADVRRTFSTLLRRAGIEGKWTPYEMRHAAVSLLSDAAVPSGQIADLPGIATLDGVAHLPPRGRSPWTVRPL